MDMMKLEHLQLEIDALADDEFAQLRRWIADRDWERWDEQLEADVELGKLDFFREEALGVNAITEKHVAVASSTGTSQ